MKTKLVGVLLSSALCLSVATAAPSTEFGQQGRQSGEGLCRRAAALPPMPREVAVRDERQQRRRGERVTAMEAPPPDPVPTPMPAPPAYAAEDSDSVVVTGSRVPAPVMSSPSPVATMSADGRSAEGLVAEASPPAPERGYGRVAQPQAGQLTAGDHDDLLNPDLYADYVAKFLQSQWRDDVPILDTRRVLTVAVQDRAGRPVPFAPVRLTCADGNSLTLETLADGTAVFFPGLDRLGDRVRMAVDRGDTREILLSGEAGAQRHTVTLGTRAPLVTRFDLAIVLDTTGSMGDEIEFLKSELRSIVAELRRGHPNLDIRLALVAYRDEGDVFVTRTYPFTGNESAMQASLRAQSADGGGDYPEAMDQALARATALDWRPDAVRSLLLVADAPPHEENVAKTWMVAEAARARRIQIVPVAASGVAVLAEYVMRAMATATQSRYLFLTDDSGIGNPHAPPAIDCHLVTRLDTLVRRVLDGQISGRRIEPRDGEIIRAVGQYDNGRCILPPDFKAQELDRRQ